MILSPNRPLRPKQQEAERDEVSEPALDAAADQRPPVELAHLLADADDQPADDGAGDRGEAAQDQHRQRLQRHDLEREGDIRARAPHDAGDQRDDAGGEPDDDPDLVQRDADRKRRLVAVGDGPQRPADAGILEEDRQQRDHDRGDDGRRDVDLLQRDEPAKDLKVDGAAGQIELFRDHALGTAAEHGLAKTDQEIGDAEGRHEQDDVGLVDQRPQHDALDRHGQHEHHAERQNHGEESRHAHLVEPDQRQRREHHHDALGEVEHARGLEDQHEAERDQGVEHAGDEPLPDGLGEQIGRLRPSAGTGR
jgi:hypothetical protein